MTMCGPTPRHGRWIGSRFEGYSDWTDERVDVLKALYKDGLSASQIAAELGGITRNAVIGKCHRLGLTGRQRRASATPKQPRVQRRASGFKRSGNLLLSIAKVEPLPEPHIEDGAIPAEQRKTLLQLTPTCCRYPVGDPAAPEFFFCGAEAEADRPYCAGHCARAFDSASTRRSSQAAKAKKFFGRECERRP